jgi:hypothetical protein
VGEAKIAKMVKIMATSAKSGILIDKSGEAKIAKVARFSTF